MPESKDIHVFIPAYNEAKVIEGVIEDLRSKGYEHIYVVDDGSTDNTGAIAKKAGAKVIRHCINRGAGAATATGILYARKHQLPFVVLIDGDGQHFPEDIVALAECQESTNCDIVVGSRFMKLLPDVPKIRKIYNGIANLLINSFCKNNYTDTQSGFRLLNNRAINRLDITLDDFAFCSEMLFVAEKAGLEIKEVPINVRYSEYSMSKGQGLQVGIYTAIHFLRRVIFK